jgi:methyl-accepting chemotaxis protein
MFWGRRTFLVDPSFQLKYSFILGAIGVLIGVICAVTMYLVRRRLLADISLSPALIEELTSVNRHVTWVVLIVAILCGVVLGVFGLLITHRIAGPIYALTQFVAALARGRYPLVRPIRRSDELKDFFELFRKSVESLRAREVEEIFRIEELILELSAVKGAAVENAVKSLRMLKQNKVASIGHLGEPDPELGLENPVSELELAPSQKAAGG